MAAPVKVPILYAPPPESVTRQLLAKLLHVRGYRELQIPPYRLLYRIELGRVLVLGVFDGRRNLEDVLLQRVFWSLTEGVE